MSLRTRLLWVFVALAIVPLIALGVFEYARSAEAVRRLIVGQTSPIAERVARELNERVRIMTGDLRLLAGTADTRRIVAAAWSDSASARDSRLAARSFLDDAWRVFGSSYAWIAVRDSAGRDLERLGELPMDRTDVPVFNSTAPVVLLTTQVQDSLGRDIGSVVAAARLDALVPPALVETRVGHDGYTVIAVRNGQQIWDPLRTVSPRGAVALAATRYAEKTIPDSSPDLVTATYAELDTLRMATIATFAGSPVVVISSAAVEEFAAPFAQVRATNLTLALLLTGALAVAFIVITRRTTRPLETLTSAAAEIGRGNFLPDLPAAGDDEIGRLTEAFATMSTHVDRMMKELETSRQMAAVGSFARQIAHEIRNPLTSIKLNLQSLERDVRDGVVPADGRRTMEICLEEIHRLDRVVRGVLKLGRERSNGRRFTTANSIVERALGIVRPQLEHQRISLTYQPHSDPLPIIADEERLVGALLNLLVNAAEAMPQGGELRIAVARAGGGNPGTSAIITIADSGVGIPPQARSSIFEPFFTTKAEGSGLGLAVALRDAEAHHGNITLLDDDGTRGATFVVELPLADERV